MSAESLPPAVSPIPSALANPSHASTPMNVYTRQIPSEADMNSERSSMGSGHRGSLIDSAVDGILGLVEAPKKAFQKRRILRKHKKAMKKQQAQLNGSENVSDGLEGLDVTLTDPDDDEETDCSDEENPLHTVPYAILRQSSSKGWELNLVGTIDKHDDPYHAYLHAIPCYDLAPSNGSVVILDSNLTLHMSFVSLSESDKRAALVWNGEEKCIVAMLTYTDFLEALLHAESSDELHNKTLGAYFGEMKNRKPLVTVNVTTNLWDVAHRLLEYHVHRLPVMELVPEGESLSETDILFMVTVKDIFSESLMKQLGTVATITPYMSENIGNKKIGTWGNIQTITEKADLRLAVRLFLLKNVSSLPVIDGDGKPLTVLTKYDVIALMAAQERSTYKQVLGMPVSAAVACRTEDKVVQASTACPAFCSPSTTIGAAINQLLQDDHLHCLFALDDHGQIVAAVSVADLMSFVLSSALDNSEEAIPTAS
uniref:CBS domain-containing protein n=1 Tax=Plectus sambesii TaxID=2011161 RepID=A0A914W231_9BILA